MKTFYLQGVDINVVEGSLQEALPIAEVLQGFQKLRGTLFRRVWFGGSQERLGKDNTAQLRHNIADSGTKAIPVYREIREKLDKLAIIQNMPFTSC